MKRLLPALLSGLFLLTFFTDLAAQTPRTRAYLWTRYETGDKPTQTDYRDVFASFFSKVEDSLYISQLRGVDTLLTDATLTGATDRQIPTAAAVKTYVDNAISGGVGAVTSVFGRTGGITAGAGDYTASQITNTPAGDIAATTVQAALNELDNEKLQDTTGSVDADNIATGAVGADELASSGVTLGTYGSDTQIPVITVDADGRITSASNVAAAGGGGGVADGDKTDIDVSSSGSIWTIDTSAVTTVKIANDAVTGAKIAASTIDSTDIATGGIGNTDLQDAIVTSGKIATGAVNYSALSAAVKDSLGRVESVVALNDSTLVVTYVDGAEDTLDVGGGVGGGGGGTAVDTLNNYTALRAYTGDANAVYLNGTGVAGLFRRVATGTENGGTLIAASNGVKWKRDWDGVNVFIDWFDAVVGDSITDDQPALQSIFSNVVQHGMTIHGNVAKQYLLGYDLQTGKDCTLKNVNLKRGPAIKTELKATAASGANFIVVNDTTGFRAGRIIAIIDTTSTYAGKGDEELAIDLTISSVSNDTLYLTGTVSLPDNGNLDGPGFFPVGSPVIVDSYMLRSAGWKLNLTECKLNGNRANNDWTYSWRVNRGVDKPLDNSRWENNEIYEMPCEVVFVAGGFIANKNYFHDCNGSAIHISSAVDNVTIISNNRFERMNEVDYKIAIHNEGVITGSSAARRVIIEGNVAVDCGNGFAGPATGGDFAWVIDGNYVENAKFLFLGTGGFETYVYDVMISNNICKNCGGIEMQMGDFIFDGYGFENITIADNDLENSKIYLNNVSNVKITNNSFKYSSYPDTLGFNIDLAAQTSLVELLQCAGVDIVDNRFEYMLPDPDEVRTAIRFTRPGPNPMRIDSLTTTRFSYSSSYFSILDNKILGFPVAITDNNTDSTAYLSQHLAFDIIGNIITMHDSTEANYAIRCTAGMNVRNNTIFGNSNTEYGLEIHGSRLADVALVSGPWVIGNRVEGIPVSAFVGPWVAVYSAEVNNNLFSGTITDTFATSPVEFNKAILQKTIPLARIRMNPTWY